MQAFLYILVTICGLLGSYAKIWYNNSCKRTKTKIMETPVAPPIGPETANHGNDIELPGGSVLVTNPGEPMPADTTPVVQELPQWGGYAPEKGDAAKLFDSELHTVKVAGQAAMDVGRKVTSKVSEKATTVKEAFVASEETWLPNNPLDTSELNPREEKAALEASYDQNKALLESLKDPESQVAKKADAANVMETIKQMADARIRTYYTTDSPEKAAEARAEMIKSLRDEYRNYLPAQESVLDSKDVNGEIKHDLKLFARDIGAIVLNVLRVPVKPAESETPDTPVVAELTEDQYKTAQTESSERISHLRNELYDLIDQTGEDGRTNEQEELADHLHAQLRRERAQKRRRWVNHRRANVAASEDVPATPAAAPAAPERPAETVTPTVEDAPSSDGLAEAESKPDQEPSTVAILDQFDTTVDALDEMASKTLFDVGKAQELLHNLEQMKQRIETDPRLNTTAFQAEIDRLRAGLNLPGMEDEDESTVAA